MQKTSTPPNKQALITGLARMQGKSMGRLAEAAGVHVSVLYRVARGQKKSARVDRVIARELGVNVSLIRSAR